MGRNVSHPIPVVPTPQIIPVRSIDASIGTRDMCLFVVMAYTTSPDTLHISSTACIGVFKDFNTAKRQRMLYETESVRCSTYMAIVF